MSCKGCGKPSDDLQYHLACWPEHLPTPEGLSPYGLELKAELIQVALWANRNASRSQQVSLGCSEAGQECTRRLGYRMANIPTLKHSQDPWPAIVGTACHSWWESAINDYQAANGTHQWLTELAVAPSPLVMGHSDLYDRERRAVLDWKFPSADNLNKMRQHGPSLQYVTQVQLYGLGQIKAGLEVERVGIIALGRQGWLKDMYVWTTEYDEAVATAALKRVYDLGAKLIELNVLNDPSRWDEIEAKPSRLCGWCPWHNSAAIGGASDKGCPGL